MGIKKEIYYRFTFPDYENLTIYNDNDLNYVPESDNKDQKGEVRALCKACPERVITYDQLVADTPIEMYKIWDEQDPSKRIQPYSREFIKDCVDAYLKIPKYFNLRNYEDGIVTQRLGMSLMVSDTPEVGGDYSNYTKFKVDGKTVYCAVTISSGDFFYSWCLPDEVIEKSDLRDEITMPMQYNGNGSDKTLLLRFHSNWCFNSTEKTKYHQLAGYVAQSGQEKRVFVQHYFKDDFNYSVQTEGNTNYYFNFIDSSNKVYSPTSEDIHCIDSLGNNKDEYGNAYTGSFKNFPPDDYVQRYYYGTDPANVLTKQRRDQSADGYIPWKCVQSASDYAEDLKRDFIDLEATRRILYYHNKTQLNYKSSINDSDDIRDMHPTSDIPKIKPDSGTGKATALSYEPPDEYLNKTYTYNYNTLENGVLSTASVNTAKGTPPLQIPYHLLRYALNDRPPFTDCETVLVMWVADKDPMSSDISKGDVAALHDLNWQQYAIPISCRCRYKDGSNPKHCTERFLVEFPKYWDLKESDGNYIREQSRLAYKYHTRRSESFTDTSKFPEAMYLQDLINYSNNYVVVYQNSDYLNIGFDTQGYLLSNYPDAFKKLYCLKTYLNTKAIPNSNTNTAASNNQNGQFYYIRINQEDTNKNKVFIISGYSSGSTRRICFRNTSDTATLVPSNYIYRLNINGVRWDPSGSTAPSTRVKILDTVRDWGFDDITYHEDYGYNDWKIDDNRFIALFDPDYIDENGSKVFSTLKNVALSLDQSNGKGNELHQRLDSGNWDEFYISSFGVTRFNPISIDSIFRTGDGEYIKAYPIGVLDNFIMLNGIPYGSNTTRGVVVGFANMLDFPQEDLYHFKWNSANECYEPIRRIVNYTSSSMTVTYSSATVNCTAYIMKYPK